MWLFDNSPFVYKCYPVIEVSFHKNPLVKLQYLNKFQSRLPQSTMTHTTPQCFDRGWLLVGLGDFPEVVDTSTI